MGSHPIVISIGAAATASGCAASAIRFYEQIGLMGVAPRSAGGRRHYTQSAVSRLQFIRRTRDVGMSIDQIRALLVDTTPESCGPIRAQLHDRLAHIHHKQGELAALETQIRFMLVRCEKTCRTSVDTCSILEAPSDFVLPPHW